MSDAHHDHVLPRRTFCRNAALLGASLAAAPLALLPTARADQPLSETPETPAQALERLREGSARFLAGQTIAPARDLEHLRSTAAKQTPFAAFLGCADSRVPIEILYDQGFGDLFVVRVAGNVATSVEIASLEYGAIVLGAKVIKVLGHSNCGAVKAALAGGEVPGQISTLYQHIVPGIDRKHMDLAAAVAANVKYQAGKLRKASPVLGRLVREGKLSIVGGVFDLETGVVTPVEV
ncbi:MAG: carbonic anhydrase [bacterium]